MYKILEFWNRLLQVFIMLKVGQFMVQDSGVMIWVQSFRFKVSGFRVLGPSM